MLKQRRIVVLTDDSIRSFECDSKTQVFSFMMVSAFVVWGVFSAVYYAGTSGAITRYRHSAGAAAERNSDLVRRNVLLNAETKKLTEQISEMALMIDKLETERSQLSTAASAASAASVAASAPSAEGQSAGETAQGENDAEEHAEESSVPEAPVKEQAEAEQAQAAPKETASKDPVSDSAADTENADDDGKRMELDVAEAAVKKIKNRVGRRVAAIKKATELLPANARKLLQNIPDTVESLHQGGPLEPAAEGDSDQADNMADQMMRAIAYLTELEKRLKYLPVAFPQKDFSITSGFGGRIDPFTGKPAGHFGLDLNAGDRAPVMAAAAGRVVRSGRSGAYGNMVEIDHGNGFTTRYGHLSKTLVEEGDTIKQGQEIGLQGSTGRSTGSHLHYEVRFENTAINPYQFLKAARYVF